MTALPRSAPGRIAIGLPSLVRLAGLELALWAGFYGAYLAVRGMMIGSHAEALSHAGEVVGAERALGLLSEERIQDALAPAEPFFSAYYMLGFAPLLVVALVWLALRRPAVYRNLRTALLVSVAIATAVFILFPTAPPRLVPGLGVSDTVGLSGHDAGSFAGIRFNPYAAMPSMHVGWALLLGLHGRRAVRGRVPRALFALHPVLMALTVTATGNHYVLDAAAGAAIAAATLGLITLGPRLVWARRRGLGSEPERSAA
jgi:hypothetical protein